MITVTWQVRRYLWCDVCHQVAVLRAGDMCVRCIGLLEATIIPDDRPAELPTEPPLLLRFLRWLGGRRAS